MRIYIYTHTQLIAKEEEEKVKAADKLKQQPGQKD